MSTGKPPVTANIVVLTHEFKPVGWLLRVEDARKRAPSVRKRGWKLAAPFVRAYISAMHRLFVAIRPPARIRDALLDLMGGISGARWQDDDQLHLTLRFIGEVDRHQAEDVHAALGSIHHPAFDLSVSGLGMFDRRGVPTAVWAGVEPAEPVHTLHKKVEQAMARVGIDPDRRAFHPHITLARLGRASGRPDGFLAGSGTANGEPFRVERFGLYESRLAPDGAVYTELETYPLA